MESAKPAALASFGSLGRTVTKAFRLRRSATDVVAPKGDEDVGVRKPKMKQNLSFSGAITEPGGFDKIKQEKATADAVVAGLFAGVSALKTAYCQLQIAQIPYDPEKIQAADLAIISELNRISEIKQKYLKSQKPRFTESQNALTVQINEQRELVRTYQVTVSKLEADLKLKEQEILELQSKLVESEQQNVALAGPVRPLRSKAAVAELQYTSLNSTHFVAVLRTAVRSVRSFVNVLMKEMETAGWDLDAAARAVHPDALPRRKPEHWQYAFESYVCQRVFSGFHLKNFSVTALDERSSWDGRRFFEEFTELSLSHALPAAEFLRAKYLSVVHPKMEVSFFGDLKCRETVGACGGFPSDSPLVAEFLNMAKNVWLLHCLYFSFGPESDRAVFQVRPGTRFSEVYMECICASDDVYMGDNGSTGGRPMAVGFTVFPGFRVGQTVVQSKVYLTSGGSKCRQRS